MEANLDIFQMIFIDIERGQNLSPELNATPLRRTEEIKLLGATVDPKLEFQRYMDAICKTTNQKVKASSRIAGYLHKHKDNALCKKFEKSTFIYCPLIWMLCGRNS